MHTGFNLTLRTGLQTPSGTAIIPQYEPINMKYKVNLKKTEEGYAVWCPGLPGCWSQGQTEEETLENIKEAITDYLAVREELIQDVELRYVEVVNA